jgi:hypothetical protein
VTGHKYIAPYDPELHEKIQYKATLVVKNLRLRRPGIGGEPCKGRRI